MSRRKRMGARCALAFIAVVWLNLALQPCAVALERDGDCPNCPPAMVHSGMSQHGGSHEPASSDVPCATTGFDCMLGDDYSHDGRCGQGKLKDAPDNGSAATIETNLGPRNLPRTILQKLDRDMFAAPGVAPPLNVLYCVYLK